MNKEELLKIIDGLYEQIVIIKLCLDELDAIIEIGNANIKKHKVSNFMYITWTSLIYRYSMELSKLLNENEKFSINSILNICNENKKHFYEDFDTCKYIREKKKELKKYKMMTENLKSRRNKTYAHNDEKYYYFLPAAINEYKLDIVEIKEVVELLLNIAETLASNLGKTDLFFLAPTDDVKRLFGIKTNDEIQIEKILEGIKPKE